MDRGDPLEQIVQRFIRDLQRRQRWQRRAAVLCLVTVFLGLLLAASHHRDLTALLRGEIDLLGQPRYQPPHPTDVVALARVDLDLVHNELLPQWFSVLARHGIRLDRDRADQLYGRLEGELRGDPNLSGILSELNYQLLSRQFVQSAHRLHYLLWAWNDYLRRVEQPYWIRGAAHRSEYGARFRVKTYDLLEQPRVRVGAVPYRVGLVTRKDDRTVREPYLGAAIKSERGAFVVVDRTHDFAVEALWSLLDEAGDPARARVPAAFAPAVREEMRSQLPVWAIETLAWTAPLRRQIDDALDALNQRGPCTGSRVQGTVPWYGFPLDHLEQVARIATSQRRYRCPSVTPEEAEALLEASRSLQTTPGLEEALGALTAWVGRAITVHEVRHLADSDQADGLSTPLPCRVCPEEMTTVVRAEISAFLAAIAWSGLPYTALYQACHSVEREFDAHSQALQFIVDQLFTGCDQPPPLDLAERARSLEVTLFGRSDAIEVAGDYPEWFDLPSQLKPGSGI